MAAHLLFICRHNCNFMRVLAHLHFTTALGSSYCHYPHFLGLGGLKSFWFLVNILGLFENNLEIYVDISHSNLLSRSPHFRSKSFARRKEKFRLSCWFTPECPEVYSVSYWFILVLFAILNLCPNYLSLKRKVLFFF